MNKSTWTLYPIDQHNFKTSGTNVLAEASVSNTSADRQIEFPADINQLADQSQ
jgi:hypothetical protein